MEFIKYKSRYYAVVCHDILSVDIFPIDKKITEYSSLYIGFVPRIEYKKLKPINIFERIYCWCYFKFNN